MESDLETLLQTVEVSLLKHGKEELEELVLTTNLYKPFKVSPKPIIFLVFKS